MAVSNDGTVVCDCCDLDVAERSTWAVYVTGLVRGHRCRMCCDHQGDPVKMAQDHEDEVRRRWGRTVDDWHAAEDRAHDYKKKMLAAYRSRDDILRQFEKLSRHHRATDKGCICGQRDCRDLEIIGADWIIGYIDRMNEREAS
jgi:hypothetical protein